MDTYLGQVQKLTDQELLEELRELSQEGEEPGPITDTTRAVYQRQIARRMAEKAKGEWVWSSCGPLVGYINRSIASHPLLVPSFSQSTTVTASNTIIMTLRQYLNPYFFLPWLLANNSSVKVLSWSLHHS